MESENPLKRPREEDQPEETAEEETAPYRPPNDGKFDIIYADPAWDYAGRQMHLDTTVTSTALHHYQTVPLNTLKTLDVPSISAKDCLLFMWTSSPHLEQAIELMKAWQFEYKTIAFVWDKQKTNPGYYTMSQCEICLVGKKKGGSIPKPRGARNARQFISEMRTEHSAKPTEVRNRIELMFPLQRKIELFARTPTPGWSIWGNEVVNSVDIPWTGARGGAAV